MANSILFNSALVSYTKIGEGVPLVMLHGFCEDRSIWDDMLEPLSKRNAVIAIDLPGFGESDLAPRPSIAYYADAVLAVLDKENIDQAIICGHSLGGYVTLDLLKRASDRLIGIGLINSHPYIDSDFKKQTRRRSIGFITTNGSALYVKQMITALFNNAFGKAHRVIVERLVYRASNYKPQGIIDAQTAMIEREGHTDTLLQCTIPVLFIIGMKDELILPKDNLYQTTLPKVSQVTIFKKVAHMAMFEAPRDTIKAINKFCDFVKR